MMKFLVKVGEKQYNISELVSKVSFSDSLNDGCSKLEFSYINDDINITNGSVVSFVYDSTKIFYGYVFKVTRNKGNETSCIAYDQLRYCKARDTITIKGDTVTTLIHKMCNYFKLKKGELIDTGYKLATDVKDDTAWLDIIYSAIEETKKNKNKHYLLRDEYGSISLCDIDDLKLDLYLGDNSLAYDYSFSKSIDSDFYNQIKIGLKNGNAANQYITKNDPKSIANYGLLQYYETANNTNTAQASSKAVTLLKQYNKENETLSISCLGDTRIRAGSSFYGRIEDINYKKRLIVKSVTHDFIPIHTMEVEAML